MAGRVGKGRTALRVSTCLLAMSVVGSGCTKSAGLTAAPSRRVPSPTKGHSASVSSSGFPPVSAWTQQAILIANTAPVGFVADGFGSSTALSADGTIAIVGDAIGKVYVFTRSNPVWTKAQLIPVDSANGDDFGSSVAISGDGNTAIVGADGWRFFTGAVYVFARHGSAWTQQAKLTASDGAYRDFFGSSVALSADGSTALVGADGRAGRTGAAYVFARSGSVWTQAGLIANDGPIRDFASSAALSADGHTAVVGADGGDSGAGGAFVATGNGTAWTQAQLIAQDGTSGDDFGFFVALSANGTTALVGAQSAGEDTGAAYVFTRDGSAWTQQAKLTAFDAANEDFFGSSVALSANGTIALVGADGWGSFSGAAYVFARTGSAWAQRAQLTGGDYSLGASVALSADGTTALVGGDSGPNGTGAAFVDRAR